MSITDVPVSWAKYLLKSAPRKAEGCGMWSGVTCELLPLFPLDSSPRCNGLAEGVEMQADRGTRMACSTLSLSLHTCIRSCHGGRWARHARTGVTERGVRTRLLEQPRCRGYSSLCRQRKAGWGGSGQKGWALHSLWESCLHEKPLALLRTLSRRS